MIIAAVLIGFLAAFLLFGFIAIFAGPKGRGIPFVPTSRKRIRVMLGLLGDVRGKRVVDLGSGDGRVVMAFAREGADAVGYEVNPMLVWWSRLRLFFGQVPRARVHWGSFWRADLSAYDAVFVYGFRPMMADLEQKLRHELKPGARVVSNTFSFPMWQSVGEAEGVHLYVQTHEGAKAEGLS